MSKNKYLLIHKDHPINLAGVNSGAETATLWLARTLVARGARVVLAAQLVGGDSIYHGVECWDLGPDFDVQGALIRARGLGSYHLISACRALPILLSRSESACISRFFIAHDPSAGALGIKPQVLSSCVDGIICVSEAQKNLFVKEGGDPNKITVIPNGADDSVFNPHTSQPRDLKRLVFAGALVMDKGVDILIRAFQQVKAAIPEAALDIYGSSGMWGREPLFDEREIERAIPGVRFHGSKPQSDIAEAFRTAAACVIPSRWFDSFPLTAVEAQACGCPVVAFDVGGVKESFRPGETGMLVAEVSDQELAQALIKLLGAPDDIRRMSAAAAALVQRKFSWNRVAGLIQSLCEAAAQTESVYYRRGTVGLISTWNQRCGLATYAKYLFSRFEPGSVVVFSERDIQTESPDEAFVRRCWKRDESDFSALKAAVAAQQIELLHINMHSVRFFKQPGFTEFLAWARSSGIVVVTQLHSTFTRDAMFTGIVSNADCILVHTEQNRLEVIANGARAEQVLVIPHGVERMPELSSAERAETRARLAIPEKSQVILAFGFIQPHKGMEGVLEAVLQLRAQGKDVVGLIVGGINPSDPQSAEYRQRLEELAQQHNLTGMIRFIDGFVSDSEVTDYLRVADLVLMNYRSQHYEASGACSLAVGAGAVILTSGAPPFISFGDAVWHLTAGYPPALSADLLLSNPELYQTIKANCAEFARRFSWEAVAQHLKEIYRGMGVIPEVVQQIAVTAVAPQVEVVPPAHTSEGDSSPESTPLRVLIQNRPGTFTQRGGDTIVIEHTAEQLRKLGVQVTIDIEMKHDPKNFDIVHLFNFATPDLTRKLGERAKHAGVPFVVTTLLEDLALFHNQSHAAAEVLVEYVRRGQDHQVWRRYEGVWNRMQPAEGFDNRWLGEHAAALITNGSRESQTVRRYHPNTQRVVEVKLGHEVGAPGDPELLYRTYGVKDFVLCVGRLESRKNQLMLLKALEDSTIPVVLVGGGFTYQPEYAQAVSSFKRAGRTLVLGRLEPEMLAAAYAAAKVHCLPSWYELPGLVSLEAASYGCAVVVTDNGTSRDYFGDCAHYCEPGDERSIRKAIEAALSGPVSPTLRSVVEAFRWDSIGESTLTVYENILGREPRVQDNKQEVIMAPTNQSSVGTQQPVSGFGSYDLSTEVTEFQELLERGELAGKNGELAKAHELLEQAERMNPQSARLLKARGAILLAESRTEEAKRYFERAWTIEPNDARVLCGLGICELRKERAIDAYRYFVDALAVAPDSQVAILQLIPCAYALNKFDDLEKALRRYIGQNPGDIEMMYCLGGCLYKTGRYDEVMSWMEKILEKDPTNSRAKELQGLVRDNSSASKSTTSANAMTAAPTQAAQMSSVVNTTTTAGAISLPKQAVAQAIEKVAVPATPQVIPSPVTQASSAIDLEIGQLEEAKRHKRIADVQRVVSELLTRPHISAEQKEIVLCIKAEVEVLEGRMEEGLKVYSQVLDANPASARAIAGRGVVAAAEGRWDEARAQFERANSYRPNYDLVLAGLGLCAWQAGDTATAWERFRQALKANPENTRALLGMMQIGYPQQRYAEIAEAIEQYLELHPADLEWMYSLAGCYFALTKLDEATEIINRIKIFKPEHEKARELSSMIDAKRRGDTPSTEATAR